ncbi:D-alanine--D-alanine ligase [bacterium]|jgi:D-alanine-D-alanine ligase|nr:D-alanine--D-alanine ligase [bacterium]
MTNSNQSLKEKTIGILYGGFSEEREVSLRSGNNIKQALDTLGYKSILIDPAITPLHSQQFDIAFIALHGKFGEDGTCQSYLEQKGIPYTGSDAKASALAMNKYYSKCFMIENKLPTPQFQLITKDNPSTHLSFPIILKPIDGGSSVDVFKISNSTELKSTLSKVFERYQMIMAESFIEGREITVGVIDMPEPTALPVLELESKNSFYDYEAKYTNGMTTFILPARLSDALTKKAQRYAKIMHEKMGCKGMSRTDMIVDSSDDLHLLEINTIPGMTNLSDLPAQAKEAGISFSSLVDIILKRAI